MLWARARLRRVRNLETRKRLAEVRRASPESETWLSLLEAALEACERGDALGGSEPVVATDRPIDAPLLYRAGFAVNRRAVSAWVGRLLKLAKTPADVRRLDALLLLEAALSQDDARVDALACSAGADPHALRVIAQVAVIPLLHRCGRGLGALVRPAWREGYCPVCGGWPTLAEFQGLERKRRLRCGRCGVGWDTAWLRCPFCNETDHAKLGYLAPERGEQTRKVEFCRSCQGYIKGLATVSSFPPWALLLEDLATLPLDVAALDRGYRRPERPGYGLEVRVMGQ